MIARRKHTDSMTTENDNNTSEARSSAAHGSETPLNSEPCVNEGVPGGVGAGGDNPEMLESRGSGLRREEWYSICSRHRHPRKGCHLCHTGHWVNVAAHNVEHAIYVCAPWLWRWWVNRPNSATRKRLESVFPGLRGGGSGNVSTERKSQND